jgi:anti-repressor protein
MSDYLKVIDQREILGKNFKMYGDCDTPWFLAIDVADWIEHLDVTSMLRTVSEDEKQIRSISRSGQNRDLWFLTEDGLYEVLFQSRKSIAKEFKKQVKQIIKDIRRRGIYVTDVALESMLSSPDFGIRLLTEIKSEREKIALLEHKIEEDKPKVDFANAIEATKDTIYIGDLAKLLQKNGTDIGQARLFEWLRQNDYLMTTLVEIHQPNDLWKWAYLK